MKKFILILSIIITLPIAAFFLFYFFIGFTGNFPTHGLSKDLQECVIGKLGKYHQSARSLVKMWMDNLEKDDRNTYLQIAHAEGTIHVKNALLSIPENYRNRIIVIAIAPTTIVSSTLCCKSFHYLSMRDFSLCFDQKIWERFFGKSSKIRWLKSHKDTEMWDNDFQSPAYSEDMEKQINKYLNSKIGE